MRLLVDVEARARVRKASICPLTILVAALTEYGRCDATTSILTACNKLPKRWAQELESEANARADEVDLVLEEALHESEDCEEHADVDLTHELLMTVLPYEAEEEDTAIISNSALNPCPQLVVDQLIAYEQHRMAPFNRHRAGGQVVTQTVESDKSNALRWLGYVTVHQRQEPTLELFGHPHVGAWTQAWMEWLREQGLKSSTLAVYCNQVIAVSGYALTIVEDPSSCPTDELLNLRKQAESLAKQERLFQPKNKNWLSWEAAQEARVACVDAYHAAEGNTKQALLRDCLILSFHTLQPPDRALRARASCYTYLFSH